MRLYRASPAKLAILAVVGAGFGFAFGYLVWAVIWGAMLLATTLTLTAMAPVPALAICGAFAVVGALLATTEM